MHSRTEGTSAAPRFAEGRRPASVIADNLLDRQFEAEAPNQRWIADFTYIWTAKGCLYVAVAIDPGLCRGRLCSRAGWSAGR